VVARGAAHHKGARGAFYRAAGRAEGSGGGWSVMGINFIVFNIEVKRGNRLDDRLKRGNGGDMRWLGSTHQGIQHDEWCGDGREGSGAAQCWYSYRKETATGELGRSCWADLAAGLALE
jgi:hypothetical protein